MIDIRDRDTGFPNWYRALGVAIDGDRVELLSVRNPPEDTTQVDYMVSDFSNEPGEFTIIIDKIGYERWTRENVKVELGSGACPLIIPVELVAELVPR